jgi:hypothetical protein
MAVILTLGTVLVLGVLLGLRFKASVLWPAMVVTAIATVGIGIDAGYAIRVIASEMGLIAVALQMGYFGGCIARLSLPASQRTPRPRPAVQGY